MTVVSIPLSPTGCCELCFH